MAFHNAANKPQSLKHPPRNPCPEAAAAAAADLEGAHREVAASPRRAEPGPGRRQGQAASFAGRWQSGSYPAALSLLERRAGGGCPWVSVSVCTKEIKPGLGAVPPCPGVPSGDGVAEPTQRRQVSVLGGSEEPLLATAGTCGHQCWARPSHPPWQSVRSWRFVGLGSTSDPTPRSP